MVLDNKNRGLLEKEIDSTIDAIPIFISGKSFLLLLITSGLRILEEDVDEIHLIIEKRTREMKEAIFRSG